MLYLHLRGKVWYYRRRIPRSMIKMIGISQINRPLSSNMNAAHTLASQYNAIFDKAFTMIQLGMEPDISKLGITTPMKDLPIDSYLTIIERSEDAQKTAAMHMELLAVLMPEDVSGLLQDNIDEIISSIRKLPKRNIQKYKNLPIPELLKMEIPSKDMLGSRGINAYLKTLKSFLSFCYKRNHIDRQFDISFSRSNVGSRAERTALDIVTIKTLINDSRTDELSSAYTLLYLSGMRLSEAYKCKLTIVDGIKCFDLTDTSIKLKTKSSYRLIPIHISITEPEKMLEDIRSINPDYIIKDCTKRLNTGTLYSLRHSFATHLAEHIEPHIISELMGHKHETMTLSRYVKGFPIEKLQSAVNTLILSP